MKEYNDSIDLEKQFYANNDINMHNVMSRKAN